ncbi:MAG: Iron-sulfur cluster repair protein ScdA [Firmicutes bacterium ADurb.Bin182]|nr:MAG: Iron-sulfur cluster repair protein ScdA [Firmicutes bacterium ADurb.Bin182]
MKNDWGTGSIGDIVAKLPAASEVFKKFGVDFCCGGHRILSEVIKEQGIDGVLLYKELDAEANKAQERSNVDFSAMSADELSSHIQARHHSYLREALPRLSELSNTVLKAHGKNHPELFRVHGLFGTLRIELEQHLAKEETLLFPAIGDINEQVRKLAREIKEEHESAGKILKELRLITDGYTVPLDGCPTFRKLYESLIEFESDLFEHIHLENNILLREV